MNKLSIVLFAALFVNTVQASQNTVKFVAQDSSIESSLCVLAGEAGYSAVRKATKNLRTDALYNVKCNGQSLKGFAKTHQPSVDVVVKTIKVVAANASTESQICVLAVKNGLLATAEAENADISGIRCNGLNINRFIKKYSAL